MAVQFSGELAWYRSEAEECYAASGYDIALARRAAEQWVHGPNVSGDQQQRTASEAIGVGCKVPIGG